MRNLTELAVTVDWEGVQEVGVEKRRGDEGKPGWVWYSQKEGAGARKEGTQEGSSEESQ